MLSFFKKIVSIKDEKEAVHMPSSVVEDCSNNIEIFNCKEQNNCPNKWEQLENVDEEGNSKYCKTCQEHLTVIHTKEELQLKENNNKKFVLYNPTKYKYIKQVNVEDLEKDNMVYLKKENKTIAFGYSNFLWESLKDKIRPTDKVFMFSSGEETWLRNSGRQGVVLVRNNIVIDEFITLMN